MDSATEERGEKGYGNHPTTPPGVAMISFITTERRSKMGLYKRGSVWWMDFVYRGKRVRKSTETEDRKLAHRIYDKIKGEIAEGKWFPEQIEQEKVFFKDVMLRYLEQYSKPNKVHKT